MWVSHINLNNIRGFVNEGINLSEQINVIVGPNNAGKSTILNSILELQKVQLAKTLIIEKDHCPERC